MSKRNFSTTDPSDLPARMRLHANPVPLGLYCIVLAYDNSLRAWSGVEVTCRFSDYRRPSFVGRFTARELQRRIQKRLPIRRLAYVEVDPKLQRCIFSRYGRTARSDQCLVSGKRKSIEQEDALC